MTITPEQFNRLALKEDLLDLEERIREEMMTKKDRNEIMSAIDGLAKIVKDIKGKN